MELYYDETLKNCLALSVTKNIVNINNSFHKVITRNEKTMESIKQFELISKLFILGLSTSALARRVNNQNQVSVEVPTIDPSIIENTNEKIEKEEPVVKSIDLPKTITYDEVQNNYTSANTDVITKAKEIISQDPVSGNKIFQEFISTHNEEDNANLINTLLYVDPYAINNGITTEEKYLRFRNVDYSQKQERSR